MSGPSPSYVLDLGSGTGTLARAALVQWQHAQLLTVDIAAIPNVFTDSYFAHRHVRIRHRHLQADALSHDLPLLVRAEAFSIDAAVCNPPFIVPRWRRGFSKILEDVGLSDSISIRRDLDAPIIFLAQNLRLLAEKGSLGIVLPDSLISSRRFREFRTTLLSQYCIRKAIRLPLNSFHGTEAQAYIVILSKGIASSDYVELQRLTENGSLTPPLLIDHDQAIDRLDYNYHLFHRDRSTHSKSLTSLENIGADITRGSFSTTQARSFRGSSVLHTTDLLPELNGKWCDFSSFASDIPAQRGARSSYVFASPGDILLARVGRRLAYKTVGVRAGYPLLTDCIFRLRVPPRLRKTLLVQLSNPTGRAWLDSRAYGVGARQITRADLMDFPFVLTGKRGK